jgi:transcriptional regulator with XRE-family HTH domain
MALHFGRCRLPELLERRHMSQAEFARRMKISDAYVSQLANGVRKFTFLMAMRAAIILQCSPKDLYEWIDK